MSTVGEEIKLPTKIIEEETQHFHTSMSPVWTVLNYVQIFHGIILSLVVIIVPLIYVRYKASIQRHQKKVEETLKRGLVYRDTTSQKKGRVVKALELHPKFKEEALAMGWKLYSLGDYLSSLRFFTDDDDDTSKRSKLLEKELYLVIASLLMKALGQQVGPALLPVLKTQSAESMLDSVASQIVSYLFSKILFDSKEEEWDPTQDMAAMPLDIGEIISFININQKVNKANMQDSPLTWMERGEIGYSPTYNDSTRKEEGTSKEDLLIPNPFIIETHFEAAILGLETLIRAENAAYDPHDRSYPAPTPLNPTILPDLYLGWGDAKVTHTQREVLRNRLFAVLFTKLSYNYHKKQQNSDNLFVIQMKGIKCTAPDEFLQALVDNGHTVEVCPRSTITTFGLAACVKEADGSFTNIPMAFFFRTGYETREARPAYLSPLHGGLDLKIQGPLVGINETTGESNKCDIQFYMAIEGMCGWHSNHNADVPWIEAVATGPLYTWEESKMALRMCGMLGCAFNQIGTSLELPFGGYGILGLCNDTAALVDYAVRGETHMYPLLSTGRYLWHTAQLLVEQFEGEEEALRLANAACNVDSDNHCSPKELPNAAERYARNNPKAYFQLSEDSLNVMKGDAEEYSKLQAKLLPLLVEEEKKKKDGTKKSSSQRRSIFSF